jgi:hypothetical protein
MTPDELTVSPTKPQSTGHSGLILACQNEKVPSELGLWELRSFQDPVREDTL